MKFIKVFENDSDYKTYRDGKDYKKPNVSLDKDTKKVHYNYPLWNANDKPFVDLDLPSGTLWATMNVGASKPSEAGLYFQWGDTVGYTKDQIGAGDGKKLFSWNDYKWSINGSDSNFTKYKTLGDILELEDDAAHVHMGGDWNIPTPEQIQEFVDNTTSEWTTRDGVKGRLFTSKKDASKSTFIPFAGYALDGSIKIDNSDFFYGIWSSELSPANAMESWYFFLSKDEAIIDTEERHYGYPVRGVLG